MTSLKKIVFVGAHGTGKSKICERIIRTIKVLNEDYNKKIDKIELSYIHDKNKIYDYDEIMNTLNLPNLEDAKKFLHTPCQWGLDNLPKYKVIHIPEQFREVVKDIPNFTKQTEETTLTTYAKQLYLENLYTARGKNILCDRSVLDTFVYYDYFDNEDESDFYAQCFNSTFNEYYKTYSKIYLIEPSDREIEDDGFRLTDKKQQQEIHQLFLEYFKDFNNVEIINQEKAHKEEFINKVVSEFCV